MPSKMLWVGLFAAAMSACAAKGPVSGASDDRPASATRNRDLITQQDLDADPTLRAQTVMEVIRALRPQFLNDHGTNTLHGAGLSDSEAGKVHVSIDNGRIVPLSELNGMHGGQMIEIRYLNVAQAMQKFGTAARQGPVILVITAR